MNRNRKGQIRSPFTQENISSPSLGGMERPVRSFRSFIKTVPPHPKSSEKPLPPTPPISPSKLEQPPLKRNIPFLAESTPSPILPTGTTSVASWKAPIAWYNDNLNGKDTLLAPPIPENRAYSPLLPEASPDISDISMEPTLWLGSGPPLASRLLPIHEGPNSNTELGPPCRPPRSPLPTPPFSSKSDERLLVPSSQPSNDSPSQALAESNLRYGTTSPTNSVHTSITSDASTKEKAFASLGIGSLKHLPVASEDKQFNLESISPEHTWTRRHYTRGKKLKVLNMGSPLANDSWEDMGMDDRMRQLSFSQDYHDLLANQYQEMNVRAEEAPTSVRVHPVCNARFEEPKPMANPKDHDPTLRRLSWQKVSGHSTPHNVSQDQHIEPSSAPLQGKIHRRISSWVPHRLSIVPKRQTSKVQSESEPERESTLSRKEEPSSADVTKALKEDLRFSQFFPRSKTLKFRKIRKQAMPAQAIKSPPLIALPSKSMTTLMRLPGGLAVVRHTPPLTSKSDITNVQNNSPPLPSSDHIPEGLHCGSGQSPISNLGNRSSLASSNSPSPASPRVVISNNSRMSTSSSYTHHSGAPSLSSPLVQGLALGHPTPPLPPPPTSSSSPHTPPLPPEAWDRLESGSEDQGLLYRPGLIERVKGARRRHNRATRQERLKKSIRVLGPTDPGVVAVCATRDPKDSGADSEVERTQRRLPGYMVSEPT